ncbi:hypothetical protein [Empedobacter brevis]|uniref:hypothetical protein n=1 Tax=Empedobacter brevis TaxID=247 RepID=UPI0039AF5A43
MFKNLFSIAFAIIGIFIHAQVGIGTDKPNTSSILDVKSSTAGILIPRIALTNTTTFQLNGSKTIAEQFLANSMLVYNTSNQNDLTEGYYYWKQINNTTNGKWVKLTNSQDNVVSARNGLKIDSNQNVVLGGILTNPTSIETTATETLAIKGLQTGNNITDKIVTTDANGVLKAVNSTLPKIFYMPSITLDVSALGTGKKVDLYTAYLNQFGTPKVKSQNAPSSIPTYTKDQLYYYVTYFDTNVFSVTSIDENGIMTYDVKGSATSSSYMNIVFVVK